jgi:hypothetical protein
MTGPSFQGWTFDARTVTPQVSIEPVPEGWYKVVVTKSNIKPTRDAANNMLELQCTVIEGQYQGRILFWNFNLFHTTSQQAVEIAYKQLSAVSHVTGVFQLAAQPHADMVLPMLHNIPFFAFVVIARGEQGPLNNIKGVKDINGNEPGKQGAGPAPQGPAPGAWQPGGAPAGQPSTFAQPGGYTPPAPQGPPGGQPQWGAPQGQPQPGPAAAPAPAWQPGGQPQGQPQAAPGGWQSGPAPAAPGPGPAQQWQPGGPQGQPAGTSYAPSQQGGAPVQQWQPPQGQGQPGGPPQGAAPWGR